MPEPLNGAPHVSTVFSPLSAVQRVASVAALAFALSAALLPGDASAQGTCRCNSGCHAYPGQCVQGSGNGGCAAGYAAFCENRANSCPNAGWVSCSGSCVCVRVTPGDAGTTDGSTDVVVVSDVPRTDVPGTDVPAVDAGLDATADVPRPMDAPPPDGTTPPDVAVDRVVPPDGTTPDGTVPPPDGAPPSDASVRPDGSVLPDGSVIPDAPSPLDGTAPADVVTPDDASVTPRDGGTPDDATPCVCPGGVCIGGRCIREHCTYQAELGFLCMSEGTRCRVLGDEAWCVPYCLGVSCAAGTFCDETTNDECTADNCASIRCAGGLVCMRNRCGRTGDGGVFMPSDDAGSVVTDGAVADGGTRAVDDGGCGCRAGSTPRRASWLFGLVVAVLGARRRRRRTSTSG